MLIYLGITCLSPVVLPDFLSLFIHCFGRTSLNISGVILCTSLATVLYIFTDNIDFFDIRVASEFPGACVFMHRSIIIIYEFHCIGLGTAVMVCNQGCRLNSVTLSDCWLLCLGRWGDTVRGIG